MGVRISPQVPSASERDYIEIQGGRPTISEKDGITTVKHDYKKGEGMVVNSDKTVKEYGTVVMETKNGLKEFNIAELRQFHGEPCEKQSRKIGGEGYERRT